MRLIQVSSVQDWSNQLHNHERCGGCLDRLPPTILDDFEAVCDGAAALLTPDGRQWWVPVSGIPDEAQMVDPSAAVLFVYLKEHKLVASHFGPRWPLVLFEAKTLNPSLAFCQDCNRWVDLSKDAQALAEQED